MKTLVFLHGALGINTHWKNIIEALDGSYHIHNLTFPGHGNDALENAEIGLDALIHYVANYTEKNQLNSFAIIGFSMGGYVALRLAAQHLKGLERVITIGTKMNWDTIIAEREISFLTPENLQKLNDKLSSEHGVHWQRLIPITIGILTNIGENPIDRDEMVKIQVPLTLLVGENDKLVTLNETIQFASYASLGNYRIMPGQPHMLERMDTRLVADILIEILSK